MGRVVQGGEPLWLDDDRDLVVAYRQFQQERCPQCGGPVEECHDPELTGELYGRVLTCHHTAAVERTKKQTWEQFKAQDGDNVKVVTDGAYVAVYRRGQ